MPLSYATIASKSAQSTVSDTPAAAPIPAPRPVKRSSPVPAPRSNAVSSTHVTEPSICIPRVPMSFSDGLVIEIIKELGLGDIEKVDLINKTDRNDNDYMMVFVHMKSWNLEGSGGETRDQLMNNEKIKIVYDDPHYLFLSKSYTARPGSNDRKRQSNYISRRQKKGFSNKPTAYIDDSGESWNMKPVYEKKSKNIQTYEESPQVKSTSEPLRKSANGFSGLDLNDDSD